MNNFLNFEKDIANIKKQFLSEENNSYFKINNFSNSIVVLRVYFFWILSIYTIPIFYNKFGFLGLLVSCIFIGVTSYKFQFIIHEACHSNLFTNKAANEIIGNLSASLFGMSLKSYRDTHFLHHKYSNTINDPQFNDALGEKNENLKKNIFLKFIFLPLIFEKFFLFLKREVSLNLKNIFNNKNKKNNINFNYLFYLSIIINLLIVYYIYLSTNKNIYLILIYHASISTISLFLARIRTLAEHQYFDQGKTPKEFVISHKKNLVDKLFFSDLNFNYHLEHHIFPRMPYKNLKKFSEKYAKNIHSKYGTLSDSMLSTLFKRYKKAE